MEDFNVVFEVYVRWLEQLEDDLIQGMLKDARTKKVKFQLDQPPSWYPEARRMKRKIIYHVGPTNR